MALQDAQERELGLLYNESVSRTAGILTRSDDEMVPSQNLPAFPVRSGGLTEFAHHAPAHRSRAQSKLARARKPSIEGRSWRGALATGGMPNSTPC